MVEIKKKLFDINWKMYEEYINIIFILSDKWVNNLMCGGVCFARIN